MQGFLNFYLSFEMHEACFLHKKTGPKRFIALETYYHQLIGVDVLKMLTNFEAGAVLSLFLNFGSF